MTLNPKDGLIHCERCGYQPMHEWRKLQPEAPKTRLNPLIRQQPVDAGGELVQCPSCLAEDLEPVPAEQAIRCRVCGASYPLQTPAQQEADSLRDVLLERKDQRIVWRVTERLMDCQNCGARVTLPKESLNVACPFCESTHVMLSDPTGTLEQPDSILPFRVKSDEALEKVNETLRSGWHGVTRFLRDRVVRMRYKPLYLPWWWFEVAVDVHWRYPNMSSSNGTDRVHVVIDPVYAALADRDEVPSLLPYNLEKLYSFKPRYLARVQSQLNQIKVEQVAPLAIKQASTKAEDRVKRKRPIILSSTTYEGQKRSMLHVSSHAVSANYRLILLPVWVILMEERDGDIRRALVNGQTGKVHLEGNALWGIFRDGGGRYNKR